MKTILLLCLFAAVQAPHASMVEEFLGEPKVIDQMRIGDEFWLPADCLTVDADGKCWLAPKQKLDEKSDHRIKVSREKIKGDVVYSVFIYKDWLQGWRWKKTDKGSAQYKRSAILIPVAYLSATLR